MKPGDHFDFTFQDERRTGQVKRVLFHGRTQVVEEQWGELDIVASMKGAIVARERFRQYPDETVEVWWFVWATVDEALGQYEGDKFWDRAAKELRHYAKPAKEV